MMDNRRTESLRGFPDFRTGPERAGISIEPKVPRLFEELVRDHYDTDRALEVFESLLLVAASVPFTEDLNKHPVVLVQAAKALIGLRPEKPSQRLMEFALKICERYDYEAPDPALLQVGSDELGELVTVHELERALLGGDLPAAQKQAGRLLTVSDNRALLFDVLLDVAARHPTAAGEIVPFVHTTQRAMDFVGTRNQADFLLPALEAAVGRMAKHGVGTPSEKSLTVWEALPYLRETPLEVVTLAAHASQIGEDGHVKGVSIQNGLERSLAALVEPLEKGNARQPKSRSGSAADMIAAVAAGETGKARAIGRYLGDQGERVWLLEVLEAVDTEQFTPELILWADAFRMLYRNAKGQHYGLLGELAVEHFTANNIG
ncbi:hypothetical protein ACFL6Q_01730 [Candidatus Neomarinimicrobiota bacterium]